MLFVQGYFLKTDVTVSEHVDSLLESLSEKITFEFWLDPHKEQWGTF